MKNLKSLKSTLQVLAMIYPFWATISSNDPDFYSSDFGISVIVIIALESTYQLISYIQQ